MPPATPLLSGQKLHPLVAACFSLLGVRALGLILHFLANDPNGNAITASPLNTLIVALPYHGAVLLTAMGLLLLLWKLLPKGRTVITTIGVIIALGGAILGQVDLGMQWFIGQRFSPMVAGTYVGGDLLSSDLYAPVLFHPVYFALGVALMLAPWIWIGRSVLAQRRGQLTREPSWRLVVCLLLIAAACRIPLQLAYGHQREVLRPPELLFAYHWLYPTEVPTPANEVQALAQLRAAVDPTGSSRWLDPQFPLVRAAPAARNRYLVAGSSERPDIILFSIESLRGAELGYIPGNYGPGEVTPTPRLDQLARSGVVFSHYIANGNPSPRGFFGINGGVWDHRGSFIISSFSGTEFDALPARLRRAGYFTLGLWGANPSFDNQLFWANKWFDRIRYAAPAGHFVIMRPLADDALMDQLIDEISAHDHARPEQPLFAYVATAGTHEPYTLDGETKLPTETVKAVAAETDTRRRYRLVLRNLDAQIGRVLDFLDTRRPGRPRVIIVVGDHSDVAGDVIPPEMRGLPNNAVVWTGALIAGPSSLIGPVPRVETFPASHVDLTPTLLDIVNDHAPTASMGTNLFADIPVAQRHATSISGQGYRLDRDGWSLFVRRDHPESIWSMPSFAPIASVRAGLKDSPFAPDEARRLWDNINTWSYLIEHNRVWHGLPDSPIKAAQP
jgi:membrane-anchored protein YejM (alkaline phosphatase superfamily)